MTDRRVVSFSGFSWSVKRSGSEPVGPGPNYFDDSPSAVRVTAGGALALTIARRAGRWCCAPARVTFAVDGATVNQVDGPSVPDPESAVPRMNLWLVGGRNPAGNGERQVLIRRPA